MEWGLFYCRFDGKVATALGRDTPLALDEIKGILLTERCLRGA